MYSVYLLILCFIMEINQMLNFVSMLGSLSCAIYSVLNCGILLQHLAKIEALYSLLRAPDRSSCDGAETYALLA